MKSLLIFTLFVFACAAASAGDKPPAEVFQQSQFDFTFKVPPGFKQTASNIGYVPTPMGNVPYDEKGWDSKGDNISTKITVMPEAWWQQRAAGAFAEAKENIARDPGSRLISEREYILGGCRADSLVVARKNVFQRIDYYLMKPDLRVVTYFSPKEAALTGVACKNLFESVAIAPKSSDK